MAYSYICIGTKANGCSYLLTQICFRSGCDKRLPEGKINPHIHTHDIIIHTNTQQYYEMFALLTSIGQDKILHHAL